MQLKLSIDTLTDFMADGWCHPDSAPRNIVVTGSPGSRSVVLVDLYAVFAFKPVLLEEITYRTRSLYLDVYELLEDHSGEIQRWAMENMDLEVCRPMQLSAVAV